MFYMILAKLSLVFITHKNKIKGETEKKVCDYDLLAVNPEVLSLN